MADLCQLADVKTWLGITDGSSDSLLSRLISAVSADFLNEIMRPELTPAADFIDTIIRHQDLKASRPAGEQGDDIGWYVRSQREIYLRRYPVNSISSVTVNGTALSAVSDPTTESGYWFDETRAPEDRQKVILVGRWYPVFAIPATWVPNIVVEYNAGYATVPAAISQAVIEWVSFRRGQSQLQQLDQSAGGVKIGDYEQTSAASTLTSKILAMPLPDTVQRVIDQYRRQVI